MLILLPVDTAATAMEPRELTAACKITLPMAVMEYWSPMGMPMAQSTGSCPCRAFFSSPSILEDREFMDHVCQAQNGRDPLGDHRGQGRTAYAHMEHRDREKVQADV